LTAALFDKEVSCRRAAAAAFQENVGRQGNFPHGIAIITEADYFSLAVRLNSYCNVAIFVGHHEEYLKTFAEHLSFTKLKHCEDEIRKLAAASLSQFASLDPKFIIEQILPRIIPAVAEGNFYSRHGAILGIAEIVLGLAGKSHLHCMVDSAKDSIFLKTMSTNEKKKTVEPGEYMSKFLSLYQEKREVSHTKKIPDKLLMMVLDVVLNVEEKRGYRGKGGDDIRIAVCRLI
jgi:hypothetical protein